MVFRDGDDSISRGVHRSAVIRGYVDASMECAFTAEWIQAFAKAVGDVTQHRPYRRRVGGIRETHRRHQSQAAAGDGDHRGIALQEGVLLDRAVKRILWSNRVMAKIEGGGVIAKHTVGHGNFSG